MDRDSDVNRLFPHPYELHTPPLLYTAVQYIDIYILDTQLYVADPDTLLALLQDLLKVNTSEATRTAGY